MKIVFDWLKRGQWATKKTAPNHHSKVCLKHFEDSQLNYQPQFCGTGSFRISVSGND